MQPEDLKALYIKELQEACSFEAQFSEALPRFAEKAENTALRDYLSEEMALAQKHGEQLCGLLEVHDVKDEDHTDGSMQAILREAQDWAEAIASPAVRDAALIASLQRMLHYAMAVRGSLASWSDQLDLEDKHILKSAVEEAHRADGRLTEIARGLVNREAA
ncbi:ferritin-like domain-containing protein [Roseovarius sp. B08]|uniref:YciE/YciF ferroxidase family protein n=1 Tax=Roseovarius sp. B08 TaxID=3449223 RepID=UPI003EDBB501